MVDWIRSLPCRVALRRTRARWLAPTTTLSAAS